MTRLIVANGCNYGDTRHHKFISVFATMYSQWTQLINQNLPHSYFGHLAWQIVIWNIFAHTQCLQSNSTKTIQKLDPRSQKLAQEEGMYASLVWYGWTQDHKSWPKKKACIQALYGMVVLEGIQGMVVTLSVRRHTREAATCESSECSRAGQSAMHCNNSLESHKKVQTQIQIQIYIQIQIQIQIGNALQQFSRKPQKIIFRARNQQRAYSCQSDLL